MHTVKIHKLICKNEKVREFKYLRQTKHLKDAKKKNSMPGSEQRGAVLGKPHQQQEGNAPRQSTPHFTKNSNNNDNNNNKTKNKKHSPKHKQTKNNRVMDQCVLPTTTYGCQIWSLNKQLTNKLRTAQRAMERKMLGRKLHCKVPCSQIRKRTKMIDIIEYTVKQQ